MYGGYHLASWDMREDTNLVCCVTGVMTPRRTILFRVFSIWTQYSMGTFHWLCWKGNGQVGKDGIGSWHVSNGAEGEREGNLEG